MDSNKLNQRLTLVANFGVILGLLLVAWEVQQNSHLMRIQISQARADAAMVSNAQLFDSEYMPAILVKTDSGDELSAEEWHRYVSWFRAWNRNQENVLHQYNAGMLGANIPRSVEGFVKDMIDRHDYSRKAWVETKPGYTSEYIMFVESIIGER